MQAKRNQKSCVYLQQSAIIPEFLTAIAVLLMHVQRIFRINVIIANQSMRKAFTDPDTKIMVKTGNKGNAFF